jgi:hypothetical protein
MAKVKVNNPKEIKNQASLSIPGIDLTNEDLKQFKAKLIDGLIDKILDTTVIENAVSNIISDLNININIPTINIPIEKVQKTVEKLLIDDLKMNPENYVNSNSLSKGLSIKIVAKD